MAESITIAAAATPLGKSALAVLRISGADAFEITARCIKEKTLFEKAPPRYVQLYIAKDPSSEKTIDQITAVKYSSPRSFTGENMVEIICHGGQFIIKEIFNAIINAGARSATGGEFTKRALLNGKIDLMKAEGIRGLIESCSDIDLLCAQKLYRGTAHDAIEKLRNELMELLIGIEAQIEFGETDNIVDTGIGEKKKIEYFLLRLKKDIEKREKIHIIENGINIVIAGPVNAGKSTLFNTLVGYNRAIVHSEPGTTRDTVSEHLLFHGNEIQLIDSAGIRNTNNEIEMEGIARTRNAIKKAGILVWVTAADERFSEEEMLELIANKDKKPLCVLNKIDKKNGREKSIKLKKANIETVLVSLKKNINIDQMVSKIEKKIIKIKLQIETPDILLNARHEEIGKLVYKEILLARNEWERPEVAAYHLKNGISFMDELFGKVHSEEIMNKIFKDFCIGK
jgi:tRNA modification GTPase